MNHVETYLASLTAEQLRGLVLELASTSKGATRMLAARADLAGRHNEGVAAQMLAAVTSALSSRGFVDYRRSYAVASAATEVLDECESLLEGGAADVVGPALVKALTRLRAITLHADDSSGVIGGACQRAADLYARSCREGRPDPVKVARWLVKFRVDSPGWPDVVLADFVDCFDAKGLAAYRSGVAAAAARAEQEGDGLGFELTRMQLELADHDGDVDRAVEILLRGERPTYGGIVARLERSGRHREAMSYVDRAVADDRLAISGPANEYWLDPRQVAQWYVEDGRGDDAVTMARAAFQRQPGVPAYQLVVHVGELTGRTTVERDWALATARSAAQAHENGMVLVAMLLSDDDLAGAWAAAATYGPGSSWRQLADASEATRPRDAADLYRPHLAAELGYADPRAYRRVAGVLAKMRALYAAAGARDEFDAEIREIREEYRRRPTLIKALDKAKLP